MIAKSELPKNAWRVVALLFMVGALNYLDRSMITTMRSSILAEIPMTDAQFGLLTSVFLWVYGLLSPFAGFVADRFKRSWVIIGSLAAWSFVTWLTAHATSYEELLVARALMGISEAFYIPAAFALITDYHKGPTQSLAVGINLVGITVGQSLGFIGGWISETHTWNFAFTIFGAIGVLYAVVLLFFLRDAPKVNMEKTSNKTANPIKLFEALKDLFKRRSFIYLLTFAGVMGVIGWLIMGWLPTYYKETFNLSQTAAGLYATAYLYPAAIVGSLLGGYFSDRWSKTNPYARILVPVIGLSIAAPCIMMAGYTTILPLTIIFFMMYALTRMTVDSNLMPMLCIIVDKRYRATGYGILNMFATIIGGLGIYFAGMLRDSQINLSVMFQLASLSMVVSIGLLFLIKREAKRMS